MLTGLVQHPTSDTIDDAPEGAGRAAGTPDADGEAPPPIVGEEQHLLDIVLRKLDGGTPRKARIQVDDASALIELRDALAEAKPEDQGSILEQMHRIEALSKQRGKGDSRTCFSVFHDRVEPRIQLNFFRAVSVNCCSVALAFCGDAA